MFSLTSIAAVLSDRALADRQDARAVTISSADRDSDIYVRLDRDLVEGRSAYIAWVEPVDASSASVLPPGVLELPAPGWAVVSPALDALARRHPEIAQRYPLRTVLGDTGVASASEMVAYIRPPPGRSLGGESHALKIEDGQATGDSITVRVAGFGSVDGLHIFADEPGPWWLFPMLACGFGLLPALLLLGLCCDLVVASKHRASGADRTIGLDGHRRRDPMNALLWTALVGTLIGCTWWVVRIDATGTLPLSRLAVVADFDVRSTFVGFVAVTTVATPVVAWCVVRALARGRTRRLPHIPHAVRLLPLPAAALLFAVESLVPDVGASGIPIVETAYVLSVVGVWTTLPSLLGRVGRGLVASTRPTSRAVGRRLAANPADYARPFSALAALVAVAMMVMPTRIDSGEPAGQGLDAGPASVVTVEWLDVRQGDVTSLRNEVQGAITILVGDEEPGAAAHTVDSAGAPLLVGASCQELARVLTLECSARVPPLLSEDDEIALGRLLGRALGRAVDDVVFVDAGALASSGTALVVGQGDLPTLDADVRLAAREVLPAAVVESELSGQPPTDENQATINFYFDRLLLALGLAALVFAVDRTSGRRPTSGPVVCDESDRPEKRVESSLFLVTYSCAVSLALAVGFVVSKQTTPLGEYASVWADVERVLVALVAGAAVGVAVVIARIGRDA